MWYILHLTSPPGVNLGISVRPHGERERLSVMVSVLHSLFDAVIVPIYFSRGQQPKRLRCRTAKKMACRPAGPAGPDIMIEYESNYLVRLSGIL